MLVARKFEFKIYSENFLLSTIHPNSSQQVFVTHFL
jgi:hypothetical protein